MMSKAAAVRLSFGGRVQGVGFREFTRRQAADFNLAGYVKNMPDGSLQVVAEGQRPDILHFIENLMSGPPGAIVKTVDTQWIEPAGGYADFQIAY
ncbi:acylphosphatase [Dehalogenimonas formicexedens]|uniref:acylphosphatase n=1 Tax=Dehalogenimonas formicexedens TaxID=1839801 RepID=A0A1P8F9M5_9CHLR|nr:acylphosphatase [Dehalogenimonas formicexedens]APV45166.1 acylphosphatase [Dehalogenimonas formicexedens]